MRMWRKFVRNLDALLSTEEPHPVICIIGLVGILAWLLTSGLAIALFSNFLAFFGGTAVWLMIAVVAIYNYDPDRTVGSYSRGEVVR